MGIYTHLNGHLNASQTPHCIRIVAPVIEVQLVQCIIKQCISIYI